jgi:hypothetical protein
MFIVLVWLYIFSLGERFIFVRQLTDSLFAASTFVLICFSLIRTNSLFVDVICYITSSL